MRRYQAWLLSAVLSCVSISGYALSCNANASYADGFNDAQQGYVMQSNYAGTCGSNVNMLNQAYMNGYQAAVHAGARNTMPTPNSSYSASPTATQQQACVTSGNGGKKACGYACATTQTAAQCTTDPDAMCLADQQGDKIACGYNCAASLTSVACASTAAQSCLVDTNTTAIVCGSNCQNQYGTVQCSDVTN